VTRTFFFLPEAEPLPVDERELHDLMKQWRHGRATRTLGQLLSDSYVTLFSVVLVGAMITSTVLNAQHGATACTTDSCSSARLLLPTAMIFAGYALAIGLSRLFGPVLASAAEGSWLMDAPISRRRLLSGRLVLPVVAGVLVPFLATGLVAALSGMDWFSVVAWALASGLGAAAMVALSAAEQTREREGLLKGLQLVWTVLALVTGVAVVAVAVAWIPAPALTSEASLRVLLLAASAGWLLVLVGLLVATVRRLNLIRRARLLSGGSLVAGMQGAMFALDLGLIRDILVERRAIEKGHVRPTKGRGLGPSALVWRDVERLFRSPGAFVPLLMSLLVPYAVDALRMSQLNPLVSGLALTAALVPFLGSLRVLSRTGGLTRMLPFKTTEIRTAAMVVPGILAALWAMVTVPAFVGITSTGADRTVWSGLMAAAITAAAGVFGAVRWVTAGKADYSAPMLATGSGALPPALLFNLFRGIDMVALITAPLILGADPLWSLGLAVVVFIGLRGTFNMDELKAEQEAMQRDAARAKTERTERTKIAPPKR
jgi:MFS family permease